MKGKRQTGFNTYFVKSIWGKIKLAV